MNLHPLARFAVAGEQLDPKLRDEVLALGAAAVPELLRLLNDDSLQLEDSPGGGWPPIHAVDLLADLEAAEAVGPMLRVLCATTSDEIIHDRIVQRLPRLGRPVVEPALAILERRGSEEDVRSALCCVLADVGVRDDRIYARLRALFDDDPPLGATCLGSYGDPAALPLLQRAIEDFEPDFDSPFGMLELNEFLDAQERLGGQLSDRLRVRVAAMREEFAAHSALSTPARGATKPGRNDPCPCGSGKKYKRCCLK